ncbi:glycosyltransferase [Candidatus Stoquefichus massiliensis]|uniref:glycosyltransferase n=1 Tax=Candidatus Stoquefichus massiliensis TaxID=1470350 RepID=UPI000480E6FD|nr:glycosyltransferase [Candidatus Stoquefichus massiliensis]
MNKKVLMIATVPSMIGQFNMNNINILIDLGYEVHVACDWSDTSIWTEDRKSDLKKSLDSLNVKYFQINYSRSIFNLCKHIIAYMQTFKLLQKYKYSFVHCHTPIAGTIARLVCKRKHIKCIYTAHGFHFFKGGPKSSWIIFYPIEKILSKYTDVLITINDEDYAIATNKFKAKKVVKVPGVGVDVNKFKRNTKDRLKYRTSLGLSENDFLILSVGELSNRKNHSTIIKAIFLLNNKRVKYLIVGRGNELDNLKKLINDLSMQDQVFLLGFRTDVVQLCNCSDLFAFPSKREGLGLAAIEAMATGLPILTSNINGINDYSINGITGFKYSPEDIEGFSNGIKNLEESKELMNSMKVNCVNISKNYSIDLVNEIMEKLYKSI